MNGSYYLLYGRGKSPTGSNSLLCDYDVMLTTPLGSPPTLSYHGPQFIPPISDNPIEPDTASNIPTPTHPCPSSPVSAHLHRIQGTHYHFDHSWSPDLDDGLLAYKQVVPEIHWPHPSLPLISIVIWMWDWMVQNQRCSPGTGDPTTKQS